MGANAKRPLSGMPGSGGSGFYENALRQQKEAVANMPATLAARGGSVNKEQSPTSPNGITMGAGYSNRPLV
jgi:hypothetical protein